MELRLNLSKSKLSESTDLNELLWDLTYNGVVITSDEYDGAPVPWDCDFWAEGSNIVLQGGVGPSGFGSCTCKIPVKAFDRYYEAIIEFDRDNYDEVIEILESEGIDYTEI